MKKAGFDKLMEEINSRGLNVDGSTPPPNPLPQGAGVNESAPLEGRAPNGNQAGVNEVAQSEAGTSNGKPAGVNNSAPLAGEVPEGGRGVTSAEEVAPFAKHLEQSPDIQDLTNPEIKRVLLENGEFDENGNFISDGTYTVTESGNPLAKSRTFKRYPEGDRSIAQNMDELLKQIQEQSGKQKLEKYEIDTIKRFVNEHPEISVPELSEIFNDYNHITALNPYEMFGYKGLSNIKDLKQFKTNLSEYDKFITALKEGGVDDDLINKLSHLRMEYFTESMAQINPEDFKKNLEFFKTLDASLSSGLTRYDYDVLLEPHSDKYFERIQAALEFNRFMDNAPISNSAKVKIGPDAKYFENYTDEKFAQILKNIALVKDMADKNFENHHLMSYILDDKQGLYTNSVEKFRQMLGENFDYDYFSKIYNIYSPEVAAAIINAFPAAAKNINGWEFDNLGRYFHELDEAGKKNVMAKIGIASKMPQLVNDYSNKLNYNRLEDYIQKRQIPEADKILEFVNLAEPEFLRKIDFRGYNSNPIIDFDDFFKPENLDNLIECAKLHKDLPQSFREYLKSEKSIIGQNRWSSDLNVNYQYTISPQELSSRIERIKKYQDIFDPEILERIYNGTFAASEATMDALTGVDKILLKNFINYNKIPDISSMDKETLQKFLNYVKNADITNDQAEIFCWYLNPEIFRVLSADELDAIPFKALARAREIPYYTIETIKKSTGAIPKRIRDLIKKDVDISFYAHYRWSDSNFEETVLKVKYLDSMSDEELSTIGSKGILEYFKRSFGEVEVFNKQNIELLKTVPQDIKDKLGEYSYYFVKDKNTINVERLLSRVQNLKDKKVFEYINAGPLDYITRKASPEIESLMNDLISAPDFKPENIDFVINSLKDFEGEDASELNFIKELIKNPKLENEEIPSILNSLYRAGRPREMQKDFARYLIARDDVDNKLIHNLLGVVGITERNLDFGAAKVGFTKELLDNPNIDNNEISQILLNLSLNEYTEQRAFILDIINSKNFKTADEIGRMFNCADCKEKYIIGSDLLKAIDGNRAFLILHSINVREPATLIEMRRFILETIEDKKIDISQLHDIVSSISNNTDVAKLQFKFAKELASNPKIEQSEIGYLVFSVSSMDKEIAEAKLKEVKSLLGTKGLDNQTVAKLVDNLSSLDRTKFYLQKNMLESFLEKNMQPDDIITLLKLVEYTNTIAPEIMATKIRSFVDAGISTDLISDICNNAKSISIFNDEVVGILKKLKDEGTDVSKLVSIISDGTLPVKLQDKIDILLTLTKFTSEDKLTLKRLGVDIDSRIKALMQAIDTKYPIISTSKENIVNFLKHIGNNGNADAVIQNADFAQFGKRGITLEYSREEFMYNMDRLALEAGLDRKHISTDGIEIPELKLSEADVRLTQDKIQELASAHRSEKVEVIMDGETVSGTRFLGTQGGSNRAYYTQIGDKLYYIKYPTPEKLGQSVEEVVASRLYRACGIDSPNMKYVYDEKGNIIGMAGEYVPDLKTSPASPEQATDGFAVDAWLANWDAPKNDNTQYRLEGVVKVDVGGSLRYRARGEMKEFGSVVNELSTLIEQNSKFMSMTKDELLSSLRHITEMPEGAIQKIVDESPIADAAQLVHTLLKRKEYMTIFTEKLKILDEEQFNGILDMVNEARRMTLEEFEDDLNVAELLGYVRTSTGFEGILNTRGVDNIALTPEQNELADKMIKEIERFTIYNRVADDVPLNQETKDFLNSILKGVPEFAPIFGKPQHSMQDYALDIHILKVLQDSMKDPMYKQLGDTDKIVLKFAALLHDIGKRYLADGSDTGHAVKSAEYVYSILDRFNLTHEVKDRIISIVSNHHWFKEYNLKHLSNEEIATLCRRPEDFMIYQIMAKADLKNVNKSFYLEKTNASSLEEAEAKFAEKMSQIQPFVDKLGEKQVVITASRFVDVPECVTSKGRVLPARTFPTESANINGAETPLKVLNLANMPEDTDMFQYGFNHISMKDLRFTVHMVGGRINLDVFKTLAKNPMNNSAQSISMISMANKSTYAGLQFGLVLDVDNANVSHAYYANTSSGTKKGFKHFVNEMFEIGSHRGFVKDKFREFMQEKGIVLTDEEYAAIAKYIMSKQYPETQIKDLKIGERVFKKEDILTAFTYSRDQLIEVSKMKAHGDHNEIVALNTQIKGVVAKVNTLEECPAWFLEFARDNNLPIILIGN